MPKKSQINEYSDIIIVALEDAKLTNNDIYLSTYIDYRDTFDFIDHGRLFTLMTDPRLPQRHSRTN
jgi:hypothetical protein